jgi:hypothetical protein
MHLGAVAVAPRDVQGVPVHLGEGDTALQRLFSAVVVPQVQQCGHRVSFDAGTDHRVAGRPNPGQLQQIHGAGSIAASNSRRGDFDHQLGPGRFQVAGAYVRAKQIFADLPRDGDFAGPHSARDHPQRQSDTLPGGGCVFQTSGGDRCAGRVRTGDL